MVQSILVINPGSTSTKMAVYQDHVALFEVVLRHDAAELSCFDKIYDQYDFRLNCVLDILKEKRFDLQGLTAVVGRGGPLKPMESGTYTVNNRMVEDLKVGIQTDHASNLGGLLARGIADPLGIPSFIVDPISVDEYQDVARITGMPDIHRNSLIHALNLKAVSRQVAKDFQRPYTSLTLIMVHLGGGITVGCHKHGKMIDASNPNEYGPFSPERAGTVPSGALTKLCYSGKHTLAQMKKKLNGQGGLIAHLGTSNALEVEQLITAGDKQAELVFRAMAYNVSKEIGAMAVVAHGEVDAIVLTGGLAYSKLFTNWITEAVNFIAPVKIYPGEDELQALAEGALRVLSGQEEAKCYK